MILGMEGRAEEKEKKREKGQNGQKASGDVSKKQDKNLGRAPAKRDENGGITEYIQNIYYL